MYVQTTIDCTLQVRVIFWKESKEAFRTTNLSALPAPTSVFIIVVMFTLHFIESFTFLALDKEMTIPIVLVVVVIVCCCYNTGIENKQSSYHCNTRPI